MVQPGQSPGSSPAGAGSGGLPHYAAKSFIRAMGQGCKLQDPMGNIFNSAGVIGNGDWNHPGFRKVNFSYSSMNQITIQYCKTSICNSSLRFDLSEIIGRTTVLIFSACISNVFLSSTTGNSKIVPSALKTFTV